MRDPLRAGSAPRWIGFSWSGLLAPVIAFLVLALANGWVWEDAHDEGVTFDQAIGQLPLRAGEPVPISTLYAAVAAETSHSSTDVIGALMQPYGMHPPAYYLLLNGWTRLVGTDRIPLSLPALLLGILSIVAMRRLAGQVLPEGARAPATWLLAVSPWLVGYTLLARPYAMALCIALWATSSLLSAQGASRPRAWWVGFVLLSILGLHTVYHYSFVLAWQLGLGALLSYEKAPGERSRAAAALLATAACIGIGFLPWLPRFLEHLEKTQALSWYFSGRVPLANWPQAGLELIGKLALADANWTAEGNLLRLALAGLALATLACALFMRSGDNGQKAPPAARWFWWSVPLLPALILAADLLFDDRTFFISKTSFFFLPLLLLGVAAGLAATQRSLRRALLGGWLLLFVGSIASIVHAYAAYTSDHARIAEYLSRHDHAEHLVVVNTSAPGYAIPFVRASAHAGLGSFAVLHARPDELVETVERWTARADVTQLTLIHFNATYQPDELWLPRLVRMALRGARSNGWRTESAAPQQLAGVARGDEKLVVVASPVRARNFSD